MGQMITIGYRDTLKRAQELEQLATEMERKCAARGLAAVLFTLRGTPYVYQGEELEVIF